jgi:DNA-binding transcriptional regulator LsrR (DeoR family)
MLFSILAHFLEKKSKRMNYLSVSWGRTLFLKEVVLRSTQDDLFYILKRREINHPPFL